MFFKSKRDKTIKILDGYLKINDVIYSEDLIKKRIKEFDDEYYSLMAKNLAHIKGYEKYTQEYYVIKKIELYNQLFEEFSGLYDYSKALKYYLLKYDRKIFEELGMTIGSDDEYLSSTEILINETNARDALNKLRVKRLSDDLYGNHKRK